MRSRLETALRRRFFLRFHVSLILLFTFCAGIVASKLLLGAGLYTLWLRYLLCMLIAYAAFLAAVRIWLVYVGARALPDVALPVAGAREKRSKAGSGALDLPLDIGFGGRGGGPGFRLPVQSGGGGEFAGGGASDSFAALDSAGAPPSADGGSWLPDIKVPDLDLGDADSLMVLLLALLVLLAVVGSAVWLIWIGPEVLIEAAFQALLAGGLLKSLRTPEGGNWIGMVVYKTCLPFLLVLAAALVFAVVGQSHYPGAKTFREVVRAAWLGDESDPGAVRDPDDEVAYADEDLRKIGGVTPDSKAEVRSRALFCLKRKADRLAWLKRYDDAVATYDAMFALVGDRDPPALQAERADALRIKAAVLADAGRRDDAIAAHAAVRSRWGNAADAGLAWRAAWSTLQEGALRNERESGSGSELIDQVSRQYATNPDLEVRQQVAESWRAQGRRLLANVKQAGGANATQALAQAAERFRSAIDYAPANSWPAAQAWGELAYVRFLTGDQAQAEEAVSRIPASRAASIRSGLIGFSEWNAMPRDEAFRKWIEGQLKGKDG